MAINCVAAFENDNTVITTLNADVDYSGGIANQFVGAFFKFEMTEFETIFFNLKITTNTTAPINVALTLYRKNGAVFTNLGTSISDEFNNSFDYSASPAEYYICITSPSSINYTLNAQFTDYPFVLIAECDAYHGASTPPVEFAKQSAVCDSAVFYTIIEGSLPRGLVFGADGVIYGTPEEQDCDPNIDHTKVLPSFMWWEELEKVNPEDPPTIIANGFKHRLLIRAALVESPETYADREFWVCVHNNWDYDRDAFMKGKANWVQEVFVLPEDAPWLNPPIAPDNNDLPTLDLICEPCPEPEVESPYTLEQIEELEKMVYIAPENQELYDLHSKGYCEPCPEPEIESEVILKAIPDDELCIPCPEPVVIDGLQPVPASLCPDVVVDKVFIVEEIEFVQSIPNLCYPTLLENMKTVKVCDAYHECPDNQPIYPVIEEKPFLLPDSVCDDPCG